MSLLATISSVEKGRREVNLNDANRCTWECLVPVEQINKLDVTQIPWANIRVGYNKDGYKSPFAKEIRDSLYLRDGNFDSQHKGIRIIADSANLNDGKLTINFGTQAKVGNFNTNTRGLGDGGTTVRLISEALRDAAEPFIQGESKQYVRLFVYCGNYSKEDTSSMVEAWNTGMNAKSSDMLNYQKRFDGLKKMLDGKPFGLTLPKSGVRKFPSVSYYTGENADYDITEIVQFGCLFAMDSARTAYTGVGGCLSFFEKEAAKFKRVQPLLFDIIYLYESIISELPELYNGTGKNGGGLGRFLATRPVAAGSKSPTNLPFVGRDVPFTPHKMWAFPMLAAFRGAIDSDAEDIGWLVNPLELFRAEGANVYKEILKTSDVYASDSFNIGRDSNLYGNLQNMVGRAAEKAYRKGLYPISGR
jgi:hypothetical protein